MYFLRSLALVLLVFATLDITVHYLNFYINYSDEKLFWSIFSSNIETFLLLAYPICLFVSFSLYLFIRQIENKLNNMLIGLFIYNGLAVLALIILWIVDSEKSI